MLHWLRCGTPNESFFSQLLRLLIMFMIVVVGSTCIGLILKFIFTLY